MFIHIGLNRIDPAHYGSDGALEGCEFDAYDMQALADANGFQSKILLTDKATYQAVTEAISQAAATLRMGDILLLSYSGHGAQVPDLNGEEEDRQDETWVLYDRELVDDELYALWGKFERGVRIFMLSDSCPSGTAARVRLYRVIAGLTSYGAGNEEAVVPQFRLLPEKLQAHVYQSHHDLYDSIQHANRSGDRVPVGAHVILLSGRQDGQLSSDGPRNGAFTGTLLRTWRNGSFRGDYRSFHRAIQTQMPPWQTPNFFTVGLDDLSFQRQRPFTI